MGHHGAWSAARRSGIVVALLALLLVALPRSASAVDCASGGTCALGDTGPGGGTVFFVKGTGAFSAHLFVPDTSSMCVTYRMYCNDITVDVALTSGEQAALPFDYLELAPASAEVNRIWGGGGIDVTGASSYAFGAGAANTTAAVTALSGVWSAADAAALYADAYTNNGLDDWFLPSHDETSLIFIMKQTLGTQMGTFSGYLWTSTQSDASNARARSMSTGHDAWATKNGASVGVRPIRAFSAPPPSTTTTTSSTTTTSTTSTTVAPTTTTTVPPTTTTTTAPPATTTIIAAPPAPEPLRIEAPARPRVPTPPPAAFGDVLVQGDVSVRVPPPPGTPPSAVSIALDTDRSIAVTPAGKVFTSNPADDLGEIRTKVKQPIVSIQVQLTDSTTPKVSGYWLLGKDGAVYPFGTATFQGSTAGKALNAPVVGMTPTPSGKGYWLVSADGGVFAFGDASFQGSRGTAPRKAPTVAIVSTRSGNGYWLVRADGGVSRFGDATFQGSVSPSSGVVGAMRSPTGNGYVLLAGDGTVTTFGT